MVTDCHSILARWRNHFSQLFSVHEKRRLRVLEKRVLREMFGPKKDELIGEWRKLNKKEINDLYSSPNIVWVIKSRKIGWEGHLVCMGVSRGVYKILVVKPERKRP